VAIRRDAEAPLPPLRPTTDMDSVYARRAALAETIKGARPAASQGDIVTPEVAWHLREVIQEALEGVDVAALLDDLNEGLDVPVGYRPHVHEPYPEWASHAMPAILLLQLPELPEDIQYRLLGRDLVLLDLRADLIIDVVPRAIPPTGESRRDGHVILVSVVTHAGRASTESGTT
jgi:hypothetical protein